MDILGKCKPETDILEKLYSDGYSKVELYLTDELLDNHHDLISTCKNASIDIESVHTPHVDSNMQNAKKYFTLTDKVASELNATFLLHSNPFSTFSIAEFYPPSEIYSDSFCYENHPDVSTFCIENYFLEQNTPVALDIAHLYMAEENYLSAFENLLSSYTLKEIPVVHLADGTRTNDGLYFGDGTIDIQKALRILSENYTGKVVLEVPTDTRTKALNYTNNYL